MSKSSRKVSRREFGKWSAVGGLSLAATGEVHAQNTAQGTTQETEQQKIKVVVDDFAREDTFYHGDGWESLNPGYWKLEKRSLRRRIRTRGDRARHTGFPFHYKTKGTEMETEYLSFPPYGMIWRRDWKLSGKFTIEASFTVKTLPKKTKGFRVEPGESLFGICFGARTRMESWYGGGPKNGGCWYLACFDDGTFGIFDHSFDTPTPVATNAKTTGPKLKAGDVIRLRLSVNQTDAVNCSIVAELLHGKNVVKVEVHGVNQKQSTNGYFGIASRGLLDFQVNQVELIPYDNAPIPVSLNELRLAYPIGNSLKKSGDHWQCKFVTIFRDNGDKAQIRVSTSENPTGGWEKVPVAGEAKIITNHYRRATAAIDVTLPADPGVTEMYYTVWKDEKDVTRDPRTGYLGQRDYVGRLPKLEAPYRMCGLSCHAIHGQFDGGLNSRFQENWVHDQPAVNAYKFLDDYKFQIMVWEDDIWYLELLLYTTSVDDAYLQIMTALGGPTTRWQMMRHWNTLNPGDHDYGMDDVKGPEQLAIRNKENLGQDPEYMQRNFQIVQHLISGDEDPSGTENPKRWSAWKMPQGDFTLMIVDSRLWRDSQETQLWSDAGWKEKGHINDRTLVTRSLLGEEQFDWLSTLVKTDTSPLMLITGINGMHTVWQPPVEKQRNRVVADYAGWVKAGCDRVIELLGSRDGIVSVYGDVHNGCIMKNIEHNLYECSFGPIGRTGGRAVKPGFGPEMTDYDGRQLEVHALYHMQYQSPKLEKRTGPQYWNFLEMEMDPRAKGTIKLKVRNLIDPPTETPRGGGSVEVSAANTGRKLKSRFPEIKTLPNADVRFTTLDGKPVRGTRSLTSGVLTIEGLVDVPPKTVLLMTAVSGDDVEAQKVVMRDV